MPASKRARAPLGCPWLRELAGGYLAAYAGAAERRGLLRGYSFTRRLGRSRAGFFVGFLIREPPWTRGPFAAPFNPPECLVSAFVEPAAGRLYRPLVADAGSCFRRAYDLLTKYTARRPRWEFLEPPGPALVRRVPLGGFPAREREKYARNFFTESLALLQRSGLPAELRTSRAGGTGEKTL